MGHSRLVSKHEASIMRMKVKVESVQHDVVTCRVQHTLGITAEVGVSLWSV